MRVIVSAGGTGGHIYPAIAIINKIKEEDKNSVFLYIGTTNRMEKDLIPSFNIPYKGIEMKGLNRHNPLKNIMVFKNFLKAIKEAKQIIKEFNPDIVLGFGGYITTPVIYAAKKEGFKTLIHEQNALPGLSNKILIPYVDKICVSTSSTTSSFPAHKVVFTGNPRSEAIINAANISLQSLGLSDTKPLVIIVMGSLGSLTINNVLKEMLSSFGEKYYQVLLISGKDHYEEYQAVTHPKNVLIVPYLDNLINVMKKAALMVTRSGASTIAEVTAIGLPSIFIPSPYVTNNHQEKNALALVNKGAGKILLEKDLTKERLLKMIDDLLNDKKAYKKMQKDSETLGVKDSASRLYKVIKEIVEETK